ncbi:hypothetical protein JD844_013729 [Phrynosoma platyrhinos]|uniref:Uncharacterized protein n=1 Tax=Phrynosoma platyrhinos TaxID=52577 RepID=A0ABQ7TL54_PHRPL|nr:hypothetical protein JD844_013729 [Phrynosoma platyrhinos]
MCICVKWEVNCRRKNLYELPTGVPPTTRQLILAENHFTNIPPLEITYLNEMVFLDWSQNELEMDWEFIFPGIDNLSHLDLSFNKLTAISPHTFSELKRLIMLNLSGNPTIKFLDGYSFANNPLLTYLDISDCGLENLTITLFLKMPSVQALGMKYNAWNCECVLLDFIKWMKRPLNDRILMKQGAAYRNRSQVYHYWRQKKRWKKSAF